MTLTVTESVLLAGDEQPARLKQVALYVVDIIGVTVIEEPVEPVLHRICPSQLADATSIVETPAQVDTEFPDAELAKLIAGAAGKGLTTSVSSTPAELHPSARTTAEYRVDTPGDTIIRAVVSPVDQIIVPPK